MYLLEKRYTKKGEKIHTRDIHHTGFLTRTRNNRERERESFFFVRRRRRRALSFVVLAELKNDFFDDDDGRRAVSLSDDACTVWR